MTGFQTIHLELRIVGSSQGDVLLSGSNLLQPSLPLPKLHLLLSPRTRRVQLSVIHWTYGI